MLRRLSITTALMLAAAAALPISGTLANETPRQTGASLFQPCMWELGEATGGLQDLATSQNYTYTSYTNTTAPRPAGTQPATFDTFVELSSEGIVELESHGGKKVLLVECFRLDDVGTPRADDDADGKRDENGEARDARVRRLCSGADRPGGIRLSCARGQSDLAGINGQRPVIGSTNDVEWVSSNAGIGLTERGIQKLWNPTAHTIVFSGACHSFSLAEAFMETDLEYFGYQLLCYQNPVNTDARKLYRRLAGAEDNGKARAVGGHDLFGKPNGTCTAFGRGGFLNKNEAGLRHAGPGNTTVAPIVAWQSVSNQCKGGSERFSPRDQLLVIGTERDGQVTFDTDMDTTVDPKTVLDTEAIPTPGCTAEVLSASWQGQRTIDFRIKLHGPVGGFYIKVKNGLAKSLHNGRELDGNKNPDRLNGVGPNRDDFVVRNGCTTGFAFTELPFLSALVPLPDPALHGSTALTPVGAPATAALGALEVRATDGDFTDVSLNASVFTSGGNSVPGSAFSFDPATLDVLAGPSYSVNLSVAIPPGQARGVYAGTVTVTGAGPGGPVSTAIPISLVVNTAPALVGPRSKSVRAGETATVALRTSDPDGERVIVGANILPVGARLRSRANGTAVLTYAPPLDAAGTSLETPLIAYNDIPAARPAPPASGKDLLLRVLPARIRARLVGSRNLRATAGRVRVRLRCLRPQACRGTAALVASRRVLAAGRFAIPAGRTRLIRLKASRALTAPTRAELVVREAGVSRAARTRVTVSPRS